MAGAVLLLAVPSCKKYLDIPYPTNAINSEAAFNSLSTIDGMMSNAYINFNGAIANISSFHRVVPGLSDDGYNPTSLQADAQTSNITAANGASIVDWAGTYKAVFWINTLLEGLPGATAPGFTADKKKAYIAALKTMRGLAYFNLVRCFGDVPLIMTTNVPENSLKPRDPAATVYAAIEKDLAEAMADLPATLGVKYYFNNKYIPEAILAEVYLTQGKWALAEAAATDIISSNKYQLAANVNDIFLQSSTEGILLMAPVYTPNNTANAYKVGTINSSIVFPEGAQRLLLENSVTHAISPSLLNSFEPGDQRRTNWIVLRNQGNYADPNSRMFAYKYKYSASFYTGTIPAGREEENKLIRLATMYLLRAEARARQNTNLSGAAADLNLIRNRAGLGNITATTPTTLVDAVLEERRHELFFEMGYRWLDLVRTDKANAVLSALPYKAANWKPYMKLFPLSPTIMSSNPNLTQTPGY